VGEADAGLALIDEAMAGALAGENSRLDTVVFTCCGMLVACDLAGDLQRATQWVRVADEFTRRYGCPFLYARCRTLYGSVLVGRGQWTAAERELAAAVRMAEGAGTAVHGEALARLADLRLRQGRLEEAEALLPDLGGGRLAARTAARLRLARGEPAVAVGQLERSLEDHGEPSIHGEHHLQAAAALETLVAAQLAVGDPDGAAAAAARIAAIAGDQDRGHVAALAALAASRVAAAGERPDHARSQLEKALALFSRLDLPHETALVRLELARALATSHPALAVAEAGGALGAFERLGAARDADATASLLRSLGAPARTGPKHVGVLTKREQEVLRLVGLGLSNPEIAQRLFISRKTAAHHVSSLLAKLGVRNRAGAVAYAARRSTSRRARRKLQPPLQRVHSGMTIFGYHASHEQLPPSRLLDCVRLAEQAGFQAAMCSDHFAPWTTAQGHSGFAWSWLGAALQATGLRFGCVTAPGQRYHPAIVAQAAATLAELYPGRFWMALGSGEALNEHITGTRWPVKADRDARLLECVAVIRALLAGETVSHRGLVTVDRARLWSRPASPPPLLGAAVSAETATGVAGWADGLITVNQPAERLRRVVDAFRAGGGDGKPVSLQVHLAYAADEATALATARQHWPNGALDGSLCWELALPEQFEAATRHLRPDDLCDAVVVATDPGRLADALAGYLELGVDAVYLHEVGPDQRRFIDVASSEVLPRLAPVAGRAGT
jgi:probable non-F420 flavinoid oxidoreductase